MESTVGRVNVKSTIIDRVKGLPTLPSMVHKVLALVQDEDTSARTLGKLISYDQAISSRLLKVANSAYYGFMREIATVQHAIVILGFKEVKSLTLGITVFNALNQTNHETSLPREEFWMHSIGCALASQLICKKAHGVDAETTFTAALLHDIGKLVLNSFCTQEYRAVSERVKAKGVTVAEAEETVMGFTHAEVGGLLCDKWKFPLLLVTPISAHHHLEKTNKKNVPITSIVHLADIACKRAQIGDGGDTKIPPAHPLALECLKLSENDLAELAEELTQEEEKVKSFLCAIQ